MSSNLSDFIVTENIGKGIFSEYLCRVMYSVLDVAVEELNFRFSSNELLK